MTKRRSRKSSSPKAIALPPPAIRTRLGDMISLDPSGSAVGWAVFRSGVLTACGVFKSGKARYEKPVIYADDLVNFIRATPVDLVILETVSGGHRQAKPYAVAAVAWCQGVIWERLRAMKGRGFALETVKENTWTHGMPKPQRLREIHLTEPHYAAVAGPEREPDPKLNPKYPKDPGGDMGDAVGVGLWRLAPSCPGPESRVEIPK